MVDRWLPVETNVGQLTLADFRERQVPLAILTASESVIYGRYGYGLASSYQSVAIRTERSAYAAVAGPSSPLNPNCPLPATVVMARTSI